MTLEDARRDRVHGGAIGDVAELELAADLLGERAQALLATRKQHAVPAAARESARELCTDAGGRAGDDGDAVR